MLGQVTVGVVEEREVTGAALRPPVGLARPRIWEGLGLAVALAAYLAAVLAVLAVPTLLGHDESVYAVMSRHWLTGAVESGVADHRAPLLPVLAMPALALGLGDGALRAIGVVAGAGLVLATWWAGRRVGGPWAGLVAAGATAASPTVIRESARYMTDVASAALLVALATLLWVQLEQRERADSRLLLAAPLAWAAYHLRYGSALVVVVIAVTVAVMCRRRIRAQWRLVAGTAGLLVALLTPHLVNSTLDRGWPWSRVLYTSDIAGRAYWGEGLVEYWEWLPTELSGVAAAVFVIAAVVGTVVAWVRRDPGRRGLTFLVVPALVDLVAIGVASHGDPRFVIWSVALLVAAGATVLVRATSVLLTAPGWRVAVTAVVLGGLLAGQLAYEVRDERRAHASEAATEAPFGRALTRIADAAPGAECSVLTSYTPQVGWYTGCAAYTFGKNPQPGRESRLSGQSWLLLRQGGKRQPEGEVRQHYLDLAQDRWIDFTAPDGKRVRIWSLGAR